MGFWLPQNLQRKLLLHLLQQISLFSNLDTSNLDISLGSNSKFSFNDLNLYVSELHIPNFDTKVGTIDQLDLQLTVSGGLDVNGKGLHLIMSPISNEANAITEEDISFLLSKSIQNLTSSMIIFSKDEEAKEENKDSNRKSSNTDEIDEHEESSQDMLPQEEFGKEPKLTKLQAMKNKVLNTVLNKLTIILQDIIITIQNADSSNDYKMSIDQIILNSRENNIRQVLVNGWNLSHIKFTNDTIDRIVTSTTFTQKANLDNVLEEQESIYMSAMEIPPCKINEKDSIEDPMMPLIQMDHISVCFRGLSTIDDLSISDLSIDINETNINLLNITKMNDDQCFEILKSLHIASLFNSNRENSDTKNENNSPSYKRFQEEHIINRISLLSFCSMKALKITFYEDCFLIFHNMYINQIENGDFAFNIDTIQSGTSKIKIKTNNKPVFNGLIKAEECIFELISQIDIKLHHKELIKFIQLYHNIRNFIDQCYFKLLGNKDHFNNPPTIDSSSKRVSFNGSSVSFTIEFGNFDISLLIDPIKYNSDELTIPKIMLLRKIEHSFDKILSIENICVQFKKFTEKVQSFTDNLQHINIFSNLKIQVDGIFFNDDLQMFQILIRYIQDILKTQSLSNSRETENAKLRMRKHSARILESSRILNKENVTSTAVFFIKTIKVKVSNLIQNFSFGTIKAKAEDSRLIISKFNDSVVFLSKILSIYRIENKSKPAEKIVSPIFDSPKNGKPSILINFSLQKDISELKVKLFNVEVHYHAKWLDIENKNNSGFPIESNRNAISSSNKRSDPSALWTMTFLDSSLVLNPYQLNARLVLSSDHLTFNISSQPLLNIRCLLRNSDILLIDNLNSYKIPNQKFSNNVTKYYFQKGYCHIGNISTGRMQMCEKDDALCLNIKFEHIGLSLCADSYFALVQLCVDLKKTETFPDEKKYRVHPDHEVNVFEHIDFNFFKDLIERKIQDNPQMSKFEENNLNVIENFLDDNFDKQVYSDDSYPQSGIINSSGLYSQAGSIQVSDNHIDTRNVSLASDNSSGGFEHNNVKFSLDITVETGKVKLFDGYDWIVSRKHISREIEKLEKSSKNVDGKNLDGFMETSQVNLFNSIYIEPQSLVNIKNNVNDTIQGKSHDLSGKLNLHPSKSYKVLVNLEDLLISLKNFEGPTLDRDDFQESGNLINNITISAHTFEIVDNLMTSTWNKFATLLRHEHWRKNKQMLEIKIETIQPISDLPTVEYKIDIEVAPLRLHIDQDTLDFLVRFLEFRDPRFEIIYDYPEIFFMQHFKMKKLKLMVDYKPKNVDYTALRSGHAKEFMNFFTLDGSLITLTNISLYGVNGFTELGEYLENIWKPDIVKRQLGGVLQGFAAIKTFVSFGAGVKSLVTVLMSDSKQNYTEQTSIRRETKVFLKTSTGNFIKLSSKLVTGTQNILENTEKLLGGQGADTRGSAIDYTKFLDMDRVLNEDQLLGANNPSIKNKEPRALVIDTSKKDDDGRPKIVSLYADQPLDITEGLEEAYQSLEKHIQIAYNAIWKVGGEIKDPERTKNATAAAVSVAKITPIAVIRPLIGITEAVSKTLQGLTNQIDKDNIGEIHDKYKPLDN